MGLLHLQGAFVSYLTQFPRIPVKSVMYFYLHFRDEEQRSWEMSQYLKFSQLSQVKEPELTSGSLDSESGGFSVKIS